MAARRPHRRSATVVRLTLLAAAAAALGRTAFAADPAPATPPVADVQPYEGTIKADRTLVYAGPGGGFYHTTRLAAGTKVTVYGTSGDFYKIDPPDGSFSWVGKASVTPAADGKTGRVAIDQTPVLAGSVIVHFKTARQCWLDKGDSVAIVGEEGDYYKITPPANTRLFVKRADVDPAGAPAPAAAPVPANTVMVPAIPAVTGGPPPAATPATPAAPAVAAAPAPAPAVAPPPVTPPPAAAPPVVVSTPAAVPPAPPTTFVPAVPAPAATTIVQAQPTPPPLVPPRAPVVAAAPAKPLSERYAAAETAFLAASRQPIDQQPLAQLTSQYQSLSADSALTAGMKRVVEARLSTLSLRTTARDDYLEVKATHDAGQGRRQELQAKQDELAQRAADQQVTTYTAVGTLRVSALQQAGGSTLYRLADPATDRTLVYLRSSDAKYADLLNRFVGVRGDLTEEAGLKHIAPTGVEAVDQTKVNGTVTATITPPSLAPKAAATN